MAEYLSLALLIGGLVALLVLTRQYFKARREMREHHEKVDAANEEAKRKWQVALGERSRAESVQKQAELTARNAAQQTINAAKGIPSGRHVPVSAFQKQKPALTEKQSWLSKSDDTETFTAQTLYNSAPYHHTPSAPTDSYSPPANTGCSGSTDTGSSSTSDSGCSPSTD